MNLYDYCLVYADSSWAWFYREAFHPSSYDELEELEMWEGTQRDTAPGQYFKLAWDSIRLYHFKDLPARYSPWTAKELFAGNRPMLRSWWETRGETELLGLRPTEIFANTRFADFIRIIEQERSGKIYYPTEVLEIFEDYQGEVQEWLEDVHGFAVQGVREL